ncbi:MAG: ATP-binding cassette domain-containing protein [Streptosporangiales bacterium]|nr:ATP-binding cassette domain-containing protein [Streptosporangiales bacterium]
MPELTVKDLSKEFGSQRALRDVSFTVQDGEFFTLLGPSGCGKSTTLMSIAGLEEPTTGAISAGDKVFVDTAKRTYLPPEERNLGMVFQSYALWPHMTVAANLDMPLRLRKLDKAERDRRIADVLEQVGLAGYANRYPHQMSGGQQQRVALARAIVYSPTVLLLDEPLSNLDAKLRERARTWLKELQQQVGITTVYVTHDQIEALTLSDRIAVMREGEMLQVGTPEEIYDKPSSPEVADFVGRCNFFCGSVVSSENGQVAVAVTGGDAKLTVAAEEKFEVGSSVTLGIRAEHVDVAPAGDGAADADNVIPVRMKKRSFAGSRYEYEVEYGDQRVVVESATAVSGEELWLRVPATGTYVFPGTYTSGVLASTQVEEETA